MQSADTQEEPRAVFAFNPPQVDRIWGIWDLIIIYPKPYSIYLRGTIEGSSGMGNSCFYGST